MIQTSRKNESVARFLKYQLHANQIIIDWGILGRDALLLEAIKGDWDAKLAEDSGGTTKFVWCRYLDFPLSVEIIDVN